MAAIIRVDYIGFTRVRSTCYTATYNVGIVFLVGVSRYLFHLSVSDSMPL